MLDRKEYLKKYRQQNRDKSIEYARKYYKENKEKIQERTKQNKCKICNKKICNNSILCSSCHIRDTWKNPIRMKNHLKRVSGKNHYDFKGRIKNVRGYILIYSPQHPHKNTDNYVYEHRLIMEKKLGRYLTSKEVVHHINGKLDDNRIKNLKLFKNHSEHRKWELQYAI